MLEGRAAHLAAQRIDDATLERLRTCNDATGLAVRADPPDVIGFLKGKREFHAAILETARSQLLTALLGSLIEQPMIWRTAHKFGGEALRSSHGEHDELLAAFARRDEPGAQAVMAAHVCRAFHACAAAHHGLSAIDRPRWI
jgi:DNA-binding GntR family transcriptional regulator